MRIRALQTRADRLARLIAFLNRRHVLVHRLLPGQLMLEALGLPPPTGSRGVGWVPGRGPRQFLLPALRAQLAPLPGGLRGVESSRAEAPPTGLRPTSELPPPAPLGEVARPTQPSTESPLLGAGDLPALLDQPAQEPAMASGIEPSPAADPALSAGPEEPEPSPLAAVEGPLDPELAAAATHTAALPQAAAEQLLPAAASEVTQKPALAPVPVAREALRSPHQPEMPGSRQPPSQPVRPPQASPAP